MIGPDDRLFGLVRVARVHQPDRMLRQPVGLGQLVGRAVLEAGIL